VNLALSWRRQQRSAARAKERLVRERVPIETDPSPQIGLLARLTPAQRAVVVLRFFADQSVADTARVLRKRPGTVKALTFQAMERLREGLHDQEGSRE
jgi:DNA-directed RNA polymerase specialized sigma24 family protein